jgi:hypothetical protein
MGPPLQKILNILEKNIRGPILGNMIFDPMVFTPL